MQRKTPLKAKKPLESKTTLKSSKKHKKRPKLKTIPSLIKEADKLFSRYIRLRDSELDKLTGKRIGTCITCPRIILVIDEDGKWKQNAQHGHFIGRGCHFLRYNEENGNLQCAHCNAWADKESMLEAYREALDKKYGKGTYKKLKDLAHNNNMYRLKRDELEEIIHRSKERINHYLLTNK